MPRHVAAVDDTGRVAEERRTRRGVSRALLAPQPTQPIAPPLRLSPYPPLPPERHQLQLREAREGAQRGTQLVVSRLIVHLQGRPKSGRVGSWVSVWALLRRAGRQTPGDDTPLCPRQTYPASLPAIPLRRFAVAPHLQARETQLLQLRQHGGRAQHVGGHQDVVRVGLQGKGGGQEGGGRHGVGSQSAGNKKASGAGTVVGA